MTLQANANVLGITCNLDLCEKQIQIALPNHSKCNLIVIMSKRSLDLNTVLRTLQTNAVNVTRLRLYRQCLRPSDMSKLADAIQQNQTLVELDLSHNGALLSGTPALGQALSHHTSIRKLILNNCRISNRCAIALADMLTTNRTIQVLHLQDNQIGNEGVKALAQALKTNKTIRELDLDRNDIGDEGAIALAEALKENVSICILSLSENAQVGDSGIEALALALKHHPRTGMLSLLVFTNDLHGSDQGVLKSFGFQDFATLACFC